VSYGDGVPIGMYSMAKKMACPSADAKWIMPCTEHGT